MRDVKFRAWKKTDTPEMFANITLVNFKEKNIGIDFPISTQTARADVESLDNIVLMQYTGLKDKKGVEIYEGDVLFHPLQGRRKVYYPYSERVASYGLRDIDNGFGSTLQDSHAVWEVIGNIYENPELLED